MALGVMLLCSCSGNSIEGTWKANAEELMGASVEQYDKCEILFTFDDGKAKVGIDCNGTNASSGMVMDLGMTIDVEGTYKQSGDTLSVDFTKSKPKVDLYKFKIEADEATKKILDAMGMDEKTMKDQVVTQMEASDFGEAFGVDGKIVIKSLEGDKLVLENDGKEVHFTRQ